MKTKTFLFYCLTVLMGGCVPLVSLQPLFTGEDLTFDEKLLGTWADEITWEFTRLEAGDTSDMLPGELKEQKDKVYRLNITDDQGNRGSFVACLVKIGDKRFLDIFPDKFPEGEQEVEQMKLLYNAFFFLRVHTFVKVDSVGDELKLHMTDDDKFEALIEAEPKAVKYEKVEDRPVLTASTQELRAFVAKYADDERLFPTELVLPRKEK
jgi:hypothetical protein